MKSALIVFLWVSARFFPYLDSLEDGQLPKESASEDPPEETGEDQDRFAVRGADKKPTMVPFKLQWNRRTKNKELHFVKISVNLICWT